MIWKKVCFLETLIKMLKFVHVYRISILDHNSSLSDCQIVGQPPSVLFSRTSNSPGFAEKINGFPWPFIIPAGLGIRWFYLVPYLWCVKYVLCEFSWPRKLATFNGTWFYITEICISCPNVWYIQFTCPRKFPTEYLTQTLLTSGSETTYRRLTVT